MNYASNDAAALEVCNEITSRSADKGGVGIPFKCDISSSDEIKAMFEKINSEVQ